jgi:hypothetical protein
MFLFTHTSWVISPLSWLLLSWLRGHMSNKPKYTYVQQLRCISNALLSEKDQTHSYDIKKMQKYGDWEQICGCQRSQ